MLTTAAPICRDIEPRVRDGSTPGDHGPISMQQAAALRRMRQIGHAHRRRSRPPLPQFPTVPSRVNTQLTLPPALPRRHESFGSQRAR